MLVGFIVFVYGMSIDFAIYVYGLHVNTIIYVYVNVLCMLLKLC